MQAAQNNQEKSADGDKSTIAVEQQLVENQLTEERQVREAPDQEDRQPGPGNQTLYLQENLTGEGLCRDWNPAMEVILQNNLRFRQAFLKARVVSNQEAMNLFSIQVVGTQNNLELFIRRGKLLLITKGWNPHAKRPGRTRANQNALGANLGTRQNQKVPQGHFCD
ncbi:hypothetical protein VP01_1191g10 [Puccinia sorghi]|uniref:Uncharacterized protein n=1 Tax=Puccinia sorghi TaxID=27349 RepID=A0A0L6VQT1_9BASI|nr:hypothetical protein VP01_1191g10 [Puccinia sorghi]